MDKRQTETQKESCVLTTDDYRILTLSSKCVQLFLKYFLAFMDDDGIVGVILGTHRYITVGPRVDFKFI